MRGTIKAQRLQFKPPFSNLLCLSEARTAEGGEKIVQKILHAVVFVTPSVFNGFISAGPAVQCQSSSSSLHLCLFPAARFVSLPRWF